MNKSEIIDFNKRSDLFINSIDYNEDTNKIHLKMPEYDIYYADYIEFDNKRNLNNLKEPVNFYTKNLSTTEISKVFIKNLTSPYIAKTIEKIFNYYLYIINFQKLKVDFSNHKDSEFSFSIKIDNTNETISYLEFVLFIDDEKIILSSQVEKPIKSINGEIYSLNDLILYLLLNKKEIHNNHLNCL